MMSLVGGIIAALLGLIFFIHWFDYFLMGLKATLPCLFILGGALAAYLGYEEVKDQSSTDNFDDEATDLKNEVETLKEELKELKGDGTNKNDSEEKAD